MTWTVLGASGVIGRRLVAGLRATGDPVLAPSRDDAEIYGRSLGRVIYAIGLTADFRRRPFDTVHAHVVHVTNFLERAEFDAFLYLSSTRVYMRADNAAEDAPLPIRPADPSDLYNLSKLMGESICLHCGRGGVRVARLSNVVGGDDADSENFIPSLVRSARSGRIVLRSALDSSKDYIHIDDVADLLPKIASHGRERIYNVASGIQISHAEWVKQLAARTGCTVDVEPGAPTVNFVPVDTGRIRREFGYEPRSAFSVLDSVAGTT